jgi:hypothetical protein
VKESKEENVKESAIEIRITRLNDDKTRPVDGSENMYSVHFELSAIPPRSWEIIFEAEWNLLNVMRPDLWPAARVDKNFLVMRCALDQVVSLHLPFLKKAVAATNVKYAEYTRAIAKERAERTLLWERELREVKTVAKPVQHLTMATVGDI